MIWVYSPTQIDAFKYRAQNIVNRLGLSVNSGGFALVSYTNYSTEITRMRIDGVEQAIVGSGNATRTEHRAIA